MGINTWINKQRPITLALLATFIVSPIFLFMLYSTSDENFEILLKISCTLTVLLFFMSWSLFSMADSSIKIFEEISELYFRAKKAKTKEEISILENEYIKLRKKCQHQNHYYRMNEVWQILDTKKQFL